jgi:dipeptidyl-peptidase-4
MPAIESGVFDVRLSPDGSMLSYLRGSTLCVASLNGAEQVVAEENGVTWGAAEFIAAEEMGRFRGYWWSPDSQHIAACRVDTSAMSTWHIADPAHPERAPIEHAYPFAGSNNAVVSVHIIEVTTLVKTAVVLPGTWEYLTSVSWNRAGLIAQTQTRDQQQVTVYSVGPTTGVSTPMFTDTDDAWVELVGGVPAMSLTGELVTCSDRDGTRRLAVNETAVTPIDLQIRNISSVNTDIIFTANNIETPWIIEAFSYNISDNVLSQITAHNGVVSVTGTSTCMVTRVATLQSVAPTFRVASPHGEHTIASMAETPLVSPNVSITTVGPRNIPVAIVMPRDNSSTLLPVLFDPYGGPHAQRVVAAHAAYLSAQWFADQGFIVVIADNVGTPGKGSEWERDVLHDLAQPVLDDQVEVLLALPALAPRADTSRVGIRGWSFGGYLAALAVIRRGDLFHAAIAGAPVTDWSLYDTHYTERYLGHPATHPHSYAATSLINDAHLLSSPLLLIHGMADDNVVAAHTLQLSSALLEAGKPHEVLPLSGVTHMTPQEVVAENLLLHQLEFLRRHLN